MADTDSHFDPREAPPKPASTAQRIKDYILRNRLHPGDLLPTEAELCGILGVSRSSIREAMRRLSALDIVEVRHGHGTFVGQLSLAPLVEGLVFRGILSSGDDLTALREVVDLRVALDVAMADKTAEAFNGTENPELEALVREMERLGALGRPVLDADREFHSRFAERLGNRLLEQLVTAFWQVHTAVSPHLGLAPAKKLDETAKAHGSILRAATRGDRDGIVKTIHEHYAPLYEALDNHAPSRRTPRSGWHRLCGSGREGGGEFSAAVFAHWDLGSIRLQGQG